MQWFADKDRCTKFSTHKSIKKRRRLKSQRVQDDRVWLDSEEDIAQEAIRFYTEEIISNSQY